MADVPGWRLFTKAVYAESAKPTPVSSSKGSLNYSNDPQGLRRLARSQAKSAKGLMRYAEKIIEGSSSQTANPKIQRSKGPKYVDQRCVIIDPNVARAPFNRVRSPREARKRRPEGWTAIWLTLPKVTVEGLQTMAITFAQEQQHSDWPGERRRYPKTRNYFVAAALNDLFKKLGFEQFCVEEQEPAGRRVRRFVAPNP